MEEGQERDHLHQAAAEVARDLSEAASAKVVGNSPTTVVAGLLSERRKSWGWRTMETMANPFSFMRCSIPTESERLEL